MHNLEDGIEIANAEGGLEGATIVTGDDSGAADYQGEYFKRFFETPAQGAENAYDVAKILIEHADSEDLRLSLATLKSFSGLFGRYDATGRQDFDIRATTKRIESGRVVAASISQSLPK